MRRWAVVGFVEQMCVLIESGQWFGFVYQACIFIDSEQWFGIVRDHGRLCCLFSYMTPKSDPAHTLRTRVLIRLGAWSSSCTDESPALRLGLGARARFFLFGGRGMLRDDMEEARESVDFPLPFDELCPAIS